MSLIVAIFLYLGLSSSSETVITNQDIDNHQTEIEAAKNDPGFYEFLNEIYTAPGVVIMDTDSNT